MKLKVLSIAGFLLFYAATTYSQVTLKDTVSIKEVVITGSKTARSPGNVTQRIDIIDKIGISNIVSGNRNVSEAIMYKPGVSVSALSRNDANWGTYAGIGVKYSTYMLQGLPVDAFVDPMSIDLAAIDRIEVQRGPASVLYPNYLSQDFAGNQSPLAGTVNLILKEKCDRPITTVSTSYGSYNTLSGQFYTQGNIANLHYFTGASHENSDYTNYGTDPSWLNMQKDPEYKKTKIFAGLTWYPGTSEKQKFTLFANKAFHNGDAGRVYRGFDHNYATLNAGYMLNLNDRIDFQANMGFRQSDRTWQESNFGVVDTLKSTNGVMQNIVPLDLSITLKHGENNSLIIGSDYQGADYATWSDPLRGYKSYGNKATAYQAGLYAQEEIQIKNFIWRGGIRLNFIKNNIHLVDGGAPGETSKEWTSFLWSAGIKYKISQDISVSANAGNSYLTPGLKATGGTISLADRGVPGRHGQLPNPDLKPEAGLGVDLGTEVFLPADIKVSLRGFYLAITDAIIDNVVSQDPSQTQSVNAGQTTSTGIEAEVKQWVSKSIQWFANFTLMKSNVKDAGSVPFAPGQVANLGIDMAFPFGLLVSPYLNYNNGYYDSSDITGRGFFKPGALINVNASQVIAKSDSFKVEAFGSFYNVTNNRFKMPWQFQNPGFSMMTGIRASF
jgi:outer membrane receptor protein involved in Fe transport